MNTATGGPDPAADPAIEAEHLTKRFGSLTAVDDVTFAIPRNTINGLLGRNGSGKTTLMALLTAQTFATSGTVRVLGEPPLENERVLAQTCFVRENLKYPSNFRVRHALSTGRDFYPDWDAGLAARLVERFDLPLGRQVQKLSRGMTSALNNILGLASRAPVTMFDEPYLGLDATARQIFYDELMLDFTEHPRTVLLSTHLVDEVANLLDNMLLLHAGRLVLDSPAEDLRGSTVLLVGDTDHVTEVSAGLVTLRDERMGSLLQRTAYGRLDDERRHLAARLSVHVEHVSLQQLVIGAEALAAGFPDANIPEHVGGSR